MTLPPSRRIISPLLILVCGGIKDGVKFSPIVWALATSMISGDHEKAVVLSCKFADNNSGPAFCHFVVLLNAESQMLSLSFLIIQKNPYMYGFKQHHLSSISDQSSMLAVLTFSHNISVSYLLFYSYNTYSSYNNTYTS